MKKENDDLMEQLAEVKQTRR